MERLPLPVNDTDQRKPTRDSFVFSMEIQPTELNSQIDCFFNPNWDASIDQNDPFGHALSSIVSSPTASITGGGDSLMMRELIGRLGSICNSGDISPVNNNSANTSCYSTPLNSPPKSNYLSSIMENKYRGGNFQIPGNHLTNHPSLAPLNADPGFVERAAKYSCFGNRNFGGLNPQYGLNVSEVPLRSVPKLESGKLSRVSSSQSMKVVGFQVGNQENKSSPLEKKLGRISRPPSPEYVEMGDSGEGSSVSEQNPAVQMGLKAQNEANSRKRKSTPKGKGKETLPPSPANDEKADENNAKACKKPDEDIKREYEKTMANAAQNENAKAAREGDQKEKNEALKLPEPPKDYIHVRARRGQATDSHSLAERVRREKISSRMKFLQDLVPGCNKVTGKAVVLDEIINYVQSLQRQVEFLSMKLSAVNPRMEVDMEALFSKDNFQSGESVPQSVYHLDSSAYSFYTRQTPPLTNSILSGTPTSISINRLNDSLHRNQSIQLPSIDLFNSSVPQEPTFWEDNLQSVVVQTGFVENQTQSIHGQMQAEL
ncbi:hypothetical protein Nepgr_022100 [Nepenthes gracilis]|uniref:BHLH domain-containing protein n=1 Tax=Nepenthes gracilis TaxID=150966 RepID=A0AAD3T047_NEPGR|nr:hypothetical protein Nepgr_022100 [Nepenthes gracilis]